MYRKSLLLELWEPPVLAYRCINGHTFLPPENVEAASQSE
jgi:hypothetical protein